MEIIFWKIFFSSNIICKNVIFELFFINNVLFKNIFDKNILGENLTNIFVVKVFLAFPYLLPTLCCPILNFSPLHQGFLKSSVTDKRNEITDRTEHAMIVPFIITDKGETLQITECMNYACHKANM